MKKYYITDQEIEQAEKMLREKGYGWQNGKYTEPPKEYKTLQAGIIDAIYFEAEGGDGVLLPLRK